MTNTAILVTGRMSLSTLERSLYSGWEVASYEGTSDSMVAIVRRTSEHANLDYMMGRLSSFGTVGVRSEFSESDYMASLERLVA
jgi:hypothetical protein